MNVYIVNLSMVNPRFANEDDYYYNDSEGKCETTGRYTNEAPLRILIKRLKKQGQKLDCIVALASEKVRNEMILTSINETDDKIPDDIKDIFSGLTHYQYFEKVIRDEIEDINEWNIKQFLKLIPLPDKPEEIDIVKSVMTCYEYLLNLSKENDVNIYIESNGSFRPVMVMLTSLTNVLEKNSERIHVKSIYSMVKTKVTKIDDSKMIYASAELISAVDEFVYYGKSRSMKEYFKENCEKCCDENKDEIKRDIMELIESVESIASNLNLCRTQFVFKAFYDEHNSIKHKMDCFNKKYKNREEIPVVRIFMFVLKYIEEQFAILYPEGYENKYYANLMNVIEWCYKKDYLQQALTFCSETIPVFLFESGILYRKEVLDRYLENNNVFDKNYDKNYYFLVQLAGNYYEAKKRRIIIEDLNHLQHEDLELDLDYQEIRKTISQSFHQMNNAKQIDKMNHSIKKFIKIRKNKDADKLDKYMEGFGEKRSIIVNSNYMFTKKKKVTLEGLFYEDDLQNDSEEEKSERIKRALLTNYEFISFFCDLNNYGTKKTFDETNAKMDCLKKKLFPDNNMQCAFTEYAKKLEQYDYTRHMDDQFFGVNQKVKSSDINMRYLFFLYGLAKEQRNIANHASCLEGRIGFDSEQLKILLQELIKEYRRTLEIVERG